MNNNISDVKYYLGNLYEMFKNNQTIDKLGEKLIFDFSKNDTLGLISEDKLVIRISSSLF